MGKIVIAFLVTVLLISTAVLFYNSSEEGIIEEEEIHKQREFGIVEEHDQAEVEDSKYAAVSAIVSNVHNVLNNITGYKTHTKYEYPNNESRKNTSKQLYSQIETIEKTIEFAEGNMKKELEDFVIVTRYAADHYDHTALLYSHRIIHDVDTMYNGKTSKFLIQRDYRIGATQTKLL
jgi:hypothetical protein